MIRAAILIVSDRSFRGERADKSGETAREVLEALPAEIVSMKIVPDDVREIEAALRRMRDSADLIVTSGGTGVSPRDVTPEATSRVIERELPGFAEAMRAKSFDVTPHALISRAVAGVSGQTLIINLPGSPKAVKECLSVVLPAIPHAVDKIKGGETECAPTGHQQ